jgi:hypothetical protein
LVANAAVIAVHCGDKVYKAIKAIQDLKSAAEGLTEAAEADAAALPENLIPIFGELADLAALAFTIKKVADFVSAVLEAKSALTSLWECMNEASGTDNAIKAILDQMRPHWNKIEDDINGIESILGGLPGVSLTA